MSLGHLSLLEDALTTMARFDKDPKEVLWVGNIGGTKVSSWVDFEEQAYKIIYDPLDSIVPYDLVIVAEHWFMRRTAGEYDVWELLASPTIKTNEYGFDLFEWMTEPK